MRLIPVKCGNQCRVQSCQLARILSLERVEGWSLLAVETKCSASERSANKCPLSFLSDGASGEKRSGHGSESIEEEEEKRSAHQEKPEDETHQRWTRRGKSKPEKKEVPHHSKEVPEKEEIEERRAQMSPEEKELQMIAGRRHEEKRGSEEEGSASRKSEVCPFLFQPAWTLVDFTIWLQIRVEDHSVTKSMLQVSSGLAPQQTEEEEEEAGLVPLYQTTTRGQL